MVARGEGEGTVAETFEESKLTEVGDGEAQTIASAFGERPKRTGEISKQGVSATLGSRGNEELDADSKGRLVEFFFN